MATAGSRRWAIRRSSARHWNNYETAYLILAALATPLVFSVHTIVSFDFATSVIPGWHTTIFPPYFVAGAVFSGFAMVGTLLVPTRAWFGLKELITLHHLENMNKIILATGSMVGYAYGKSLAYSLGIPMYGVDHMEGHLYAPRLSFAGYEPPAVVILASGGHSQIVHVKGWGEYEVLGGTIDDAAGEAFDKLARYMGLGFPGGPAIDRASDGGDPDAAEEAPAEKSAE